MDYLYKTLSDDEKDDIIVGFFCGQERDKHCHEVSITRYELMLKSLPQGTWRNQIQNSLDTTRLRLTEVNSIIEATIPQLPSQERVDASKARLLAKEKELRVT